MFQLIVQNTIFSYLSPKRQCGKHIFCLFATNYELSTKKMIKQLLSIFIAISLVTGIAFAQNNVIPVGLNKSSIDISSVSSKSGNVVDHAGHNHSAGEKCAQHNYTQALMDADPQYRIGVEAAKEQSRRIIAELESGERAAPPIYTIPVVFHVIHKGESVGSGTNISDAQLQSAIDALNRDFRRTSEDGGIALGAGPDTEIQFCLAGVDPNGNPTSGINRVNGASAINSYANSGITSSNELNVKALSIWPNVEYLNIWVVSEIENNGADIANPNVFPGFTGGTLGYAYLPIAQPQFAADRDGIVALNLCVGNDPNGTNGYRLWFATTTNGTLTHEVGHYLGLEHVFEDNNPNSCLNGDGIADTPPAQQINLNNCSSNGPCNQQIENYMDYTPEDCQDQFTNGQNAVMRSTLAGSRSSVVNSNNCGSSSSNDYDAGISAISVPNGALCNTTFTPVVTLNNYGSTTLTSVQIQYYVDANSPTTYSWSGSLGSNSDTQVTLNAMTTTAGAHTFTARTNQSTLNGSNSDQETGNDQSTSSFNIGSGGTGVNITIELDCWGEETTWVINNGSGTTVASGGPYTNNLPDGAGTQTASACLAQGCYDFIINDTEGDGLFGSQFGSCNVDGDYQITDDNGTVLAQMIANQGDFGSSETQNFCIGNPTTVTCSELFNFDGAAYTVNELDEPSFSATFYDQDQEDVNAGLAGQGFTSNWMLLDEEVTPGEINDFVLITSYHADETAAADNWITFGPLTMPSDGGEISWKHRYVDNDFRDGYEVLVGTTGEAPGDFGAATTLFSVADNDPSTDGDLTWINHTIDLPAGTYANQQLYFALHHTALNMYFLLIDDIIVEGCASEPLGITDIESIDLFVYPNPSSENFVVRYQNEAGDDLNFSMFNSVGQEVWSTTSSTKGTSLETIKTQNLNSGVYTLVVRGSNLNESKRLILTK